MSFLIPKILNHNVWCWAESVHGHAKRAPREAGFQKPTQGCGSSCDKVLRIWLRGSISCSVQNQSAEKTAVMKPPVGIEPTTIRLRSACSTN